MILKSVISLTFHAELETGRVQPRVGSGELGHNFPSLVGRVGSIINMYQELVSGEHILHAV